MMYREIMAVFSEIHTKHINTVRGQNVELLNINLAIYKVATCYEILRNINVSNTIFVFISQYPHCCSPYVNITQ